MPQHANQTPEQIARDQIDYRLCAAGWQVQDKNAIDFDAGLGIAVREYRTDIGPADYVLFVDERAVGVVEAKPDSWGAKLTTVEEQSEGYAKAKLKWVSNTEPLPFLYESTGQITRFSNGRDPNPRSREVFTFHRPETFKAWTTAPRSFRSGIALLPPLNPADLRECQVNAIANLETSLKADRPRALVQMATGSGKTYTAITQIYRLLKHADAHSVLFLVDTRNLGEQAEQEFMAFIPDDDNRKFTELYNVQRLSSPRIAGDSQVVISTIQRMYAVLKGEELDEGADEEHPEERTWRPKEPLPVVYNPRLPPESFDVVVIDECHRSIYNLWRQVIEYFDAYLIGLTATPDNRTYGFFQKNVVSEYSHEQAVADGVNVGNDIYLIETRITQDGGTLQAEQLVEKRVRETRARRWEVQDQEEEFTPNQLDRSVVIPDQIRTVIRTFRDKWTEIFPGRQELPKTLIFAKTDSHADDIVQTVRQEFGQGNDFCRKITNGTKNPKGSVYKSYVFMVCSPVEQETVMDHKQYQEWLSGIDRLSPAQRREAEAAVGEDRRCPHCGTPGAVSRGKARGLRRYQCKGCGRTFNAATGTPLSGLHRKERWLAFGNCLSEGMTVRASAGHCKLAVNTSFRWRHRFLAARAAGIPQAHGHCRGRRDPCPLEPQGRAAAGPQGAAFRMNRFRCWLLPTAAA